MTMPRRKPTEGPSHTLSVRIALDVDRKLIKQAAKKAGMGWTEFIRQAALEAARRTK